MALKPTTSDVLTIKSKGFDKIRKQLEDLADYEVLVGFPEDTTARDDLGVTGITNAALAYIHDNGAPEMNIPARPFMIPGVEEVKEKVTDLLERTARAAVGTERGSEVILKGEHRVGLLVSTSIKNVITKGLQPPLADATLRARMMRVKGGRYAEKTELKRRAEGFPASSMIAKPLIDTGALLHAVTYVIRRRKERR